jgi:ribonuclease Z
MNFGIYCSAQAFGKIMSIINPRHAIAYHFFNEEGIRYGMYDGIRETFDGPLSLDADMMVWNVTKEKITERMAVSPDEAWDMPGTEKVFLAVPTRKSEIVWQS